MYTYWTARKPCQGGCASSRLIHGFLFATFGKPGFQILPTLYIGTPVILAVSHCASQTAAMRIAVLHRKPKSQETCHAVSPSRTQRSFTSPHRRNSSKWSQIATKNCPQKHYDFIENLEKAIHITWHEDKIRFGKSPWHKVAWWASSHFWTHFIHLL